LLTPTPRPLYLRHRPHTPPTALQRQLSITEGEINAGFGASPKAFDIQRKIQIVYLDDTLRVAR
jgi:hypothetical protein